MQYEADSVNLGADLPSFGRMHCLLRSALPVVQLKLGADENVPLLTP